MIVPQIPTIDMRAYYRFDGNTNDLSGHGFNLAYDPVDGTGIGPAGFGSGDSLYQGTSGPIGGAFLTSGNILTSSTPSALTISHFFTLRQTASSNVNARLFDLLGNAVGGTHVNAVGLYNISGANVTYTFLVRYTTAFASVAYTLASSLTDKFLFTMTWDNATKTVSLYVNGHLHGTSVGVGNLTCPSGTHSFTIGAAPDETIKSWGLQDEFIVEERVWTEHEIRRYYTKTRGFFV